MVYRDTAFPLKKAGDAVSRLPSQQHSWILDMKLTVGNVVILCTVRCWRLVRYQFLNISQSSLSTGSGGAVLPPSGEEAEPRKKASSRTRGLTVLSSGRTSSRRPNRLCGSPADCCCCPGVTPPAGSSGLSTGQRDGGGLDEATDSECSLSIA